MPGMVVVVPPGMVVVVLPPGIVVVVPPGVVVVVLPLTVVVVVIGSGSVFQNHAIGANSISDRAVRACPDAKQVACGVEVFRDKTRSLIVHDCSLHANGKDVGCGTAED